MLVLKAAQIESSGRENNTKRVAAATFSRWNFSWKISVNKNMATHSRCLHMSGAVHHRYYCNCFLTGYIFQLMINRETKHNLVKTELVVLWICSYNITSLIDIFVCIVCCSVEKQSCSTEFYTNNTMCGNLNVLTACYLWYFSNLERLLKFFPVPELS